MTIKTLRGAVSMAAAILIGTSFGSPVIAGPNDVSKGVLVLRAGNANEDGNYTSKDDPDSNGKYHNISVRCDKAVPWSNDAAARDASAKKNLGAGTGRFASYRVANSTTFINLGGNVKFSPQPGNPKHCTISGVTLSQLKGAFIK